MPRYTKNTIVLYKNEATIGVDAVPTGAADAVLCVSQSIDPLDAELIPRELLRGFFGGSEELIGTGCMKLSLGVEAAGSGTAGTAPAWNDMLLSCGTAEAVLTAPARVEYTPISTALKTGTAYYHDDGVLHKGLGAMGNAKFSAKMNERPLFNFDFIAVDGGMTAVSNPAGTFTAWKVPVPITKANVIDITLGGTYSLGAITGGTSYPSVGLEVDLGNSVDFIPDLSAEAVDITDRKTIGSITLRLTAAQEVSLMAALKSPTTQSLAFTVGTAAGNKMIFFAPAMSLVKTKKVDRKGYRYNSYDMQLIPTAAGNDEWRFVCL